MFIELAGADPIAMDLTAPTQESTWVVFLHGLGSHRRGDKACFLERHLGAEGWGYACFDFRGHGASGGRLEQLTLSRHLEDLRRVLDYLQTEHGMQRTLLIGSSLGGLTSALHCASNPGPVVGQVLVAPAFRIVDRYLDAMGAEARSRWQREGVFRFHGPWFDFDLRHDIVEDWASHAHDPMVQGTQVPTWILHGTADESVPVELSREFVARCPARTRLVVVEGGTHRMTEHKDRLLELTREALRSLA